MEWLNRSLPHAFGLLATIVATYPSDDDVRLRATGWLDANGAHRQAHELLKTLIAANPSDPGVRSRATGWLDANGAHRQAHELLKTLIAANPSDHDVRLRATKWLDLNSSHAYAYEVLRPLLVANPGDPELIRRPRTMLESSTMRPNGRVSILQTLITRSNGDTEWLTHGVAYVSQDNVVGRQQIIAALLTGGKAAPQYIDLALGLTKTSAPNIRRFILQALSRALLANPSAGAVYLSKTNDESRKRIVRDSVAHAIRLGQASPAALHCLNAVAGEAPKQVPAILMKAIQLDIRLDDLDTFIVRWLEQSFRTAGYGQVVGVLKQQPYFAARLRSHSELTARVASDLGFGEPSTPRVSVSKAVLSSPIRPLPKAGEQVEAELLDERTKKGRWRARHLATGLAGPIQNSAVVPPEKQPGDCVTLVVRMATEREIAFTWEANP